MDPLLGYIITVRVRYRDVVHGACDHSGTLWMKPDSVALHLIYHYPRSVLKLFSIVVLAKGSDLGLVACYHTLGR